MDWDRTTHNVLTMEWIDGIALSDHLRLEQAQVDLPEIGRKVIQSFLRHALRDGFFHADMHPGNLFLDDAGRLVAVDFGIMGRLGMKERRFLAEILLGFITRDYRRVAEVHFEAGYVPGHHSVENFAQAIRAIGEPIHNRTAEEISMARLLTLLLEVTGLFDMQTRPELILLQKTMVVSKALRAASIRNSTCGRPPIPWCANGSSAISVPWDGSRARCRASARSAGCWRGCRRSSAARWRCWSNWRP